MRNRSGLVVLLVLGLLGAVWWLASERDLESDEAEAPGQTAGERRAALVGRKMAERAEGKFSRDPVMVTGLVTDAVDGRPIAGAVVLLSPKGLEAGQPPEPGTTAQPLVAHTHADGRWRLEGVRPGRFTVSASAAGYLTGTQRDVRLHSGVETPELHLQLVTGGHLLTGQVSDVGGGPIEGAILSVVRHDEGNLLDFTRAPAAAVTNEDGYYRLHLPDGSYTGTVRHSDYKSTEQAFEIFGGERRVDFSMVPGSVVDGVVRVRGTDAPVVGAIVEWRTSKAADSGFAAFGLGDGRATTDDDGRFHLRGLGSGVFHLDAVADGYATRQATEVAIGVADHANEVVLHVDPAYKISGFVVARDDQERGLEGVWVGALSMQPTSLTIGKGPSQVDGYFEILGVQPGNYMVGAVGEQALPNITGTSAQVVDADVTDVLVLMDAGARVVGRVQPAMAASVSVSLEAEPASISDIMASVTNGMVRARSDAEHGHFELGPVTPGRLRLVAEGDDGSRGEAVVDVSTDGASDVLITLEPRPVLAGRVVDAQGNPVSDAHVQAKAIQPKSGTSFSFSRDGMNMFGAGAPTREDGSFVIKGVDPGRHEVNVTVRYNQRLAWASPEDADDPTRSLEIEVSSQGVHDLVLRVETRNGVIDGLVTARGGPVADAWVRAILRDPHGRFVPGRRPRSESDDDEDTASSEASDADAPERTDESNAAFAELGATKPVLTDETGRFHISGLRAGEYTVIAEGDHGGSRGRAEGVRPDARVNIRLEPLAGVEGVVKAKGSPVDRYSIELAGKRKRSTNVHDPRGAYHITRLDPGKYEVRVEADMGVAQAEVEVRAGELAKLDLALQELGRLRGIVVDQATGEGIGGLAIAVEGPGGRANAANAMSVLFGRGPTTDARGRFELDRVPPGSGQLTFVDRDGFAESGTVASADYQLEPGSEQDLGTITGIAASDIPAEERGDLGLKLTLATWAERPRPTDTAADDERAPAEPDHDRLWISGLTPDGAAEGAGLQRGDEIIAVDGREVTGLGPDIARRLLSPAHVRAGKDIPVEVDRAGTRRRVTMRARPKAID
jgi:hypothetical protein